MENQLLDYKEGCERLEFHMEKGKKRVHTFERYGHCLMGCDMDLTSVKRLFKKAKPEELCVSGSTMLSMRHGVAVLRPTGWLYISTK